MVASTLRDATMATSVVNNTDEPILTLSGAAAGTYTSGIFYNAKAALRVLTNITAIGAGSLTVTLQGIDNTSGQTWNVLASAALTGTGLSRMTVGPMIAAAANVNAQDYAPSWFQVQAVVATGPVTATIGAQGIGA